MKWFGAVFMLFGCILAFENPWFVLLPVIGLLLFLQGMEQSIAALVVECIRNNKNPDELEAERKKEIGLVREDEASEPEASNKPAGH
jgi:hypothetical protein